MRGRNYMVINSDTLRDAVQHYLKDVLFRHGECPTVDAIMPKENAPEQYVLSLNGPHARATRRQVKEEPSAEPSNE